MELYSIRDKETGEPSLLANSAMGLWNDLEYAKYALEIYCDPQTDEVVTLRVEPAEPCNWCSGDTFEVDENQFVRFCEERGVFMFAADFGGLHGNNLIYLSCKLCPNCGRKLIDEQA